MKTRSWLQAVVISAFALLATPAEAGGKKKHRHQGWNDGGYTYFQRGWPIVGTAITGRTATIRLLTTGRFTATKLSVLQFGFGFN